MIEYLLMCASDEPLGSSLCLHEHQQNATGIIDMMATGMTGMMATGPYMRAGIALDMLRQLRILEDR